MPIDDRSFAREDYRFDYQGQYSEKDDETGWNAFQLRMYDAWVSRWISTDPYGQYHSPYVGMENNPVRGVDPDGGWSWITAGIGAGIGAIGGATYALATGKKGWGWYALGGGVAGGALGGLMFDQDEQWKYFGGPGAAKNKPLERIGYTITRNEVGDFLVSNSSDILQTIIKIDFQSRTVGDELVDAFKKIIDEQKSGIINRQSGRDLLTNFGTQAGSRKGVPYFENPFTNVRGHRTIVTFLDYPRGYTRTFEPNGIKKTFGGGATRKLKPDGTFDYAYSDVGRQGIRVGIEWGDISIDIFVPHNKVTRLTFQEAIQLRDNVFNYIIGVH
jgi:RHS repeat-associated protein